MTDRTPPDTRSAATVFYDGGCPVCRREISWYQARPGGEALDWLDVTDDTNADHFPPDRTREDLLSRFTVRRQDGTVVTGAAAFVAIWRAVPGLARIGRLLDTRPTVWAGECLYRAFLTLRRLWRRAA